MGFAGTQLIGSVQYHDSHVSCRLLGAREWVEVLIEQVGVVVVRQVAVMVE
jgi:hypothetical protein